MSDLTTDVLCARAYGHAQRDRFWSTECLYVRAPKRGRWRRLWSALTRGPDRLIGLVEIEAACTLHPRCRVGLGTVPIDRICGSKDRSGDFDGEFSPRGFQKGALAARRRAAPGGS